MFPYKHPIKLRCSPQTNCPPENVKRPDSRIAIRILALPEWSLNDGSRCAKTHPSKPPTKTTQKKPKPKTKKQTNNKKTNKPGVGSPHLHEQVYFTESL